MLFLPLFLFAAQATQESLISYFGVDRENLFPIPTNELVVIKNCKIGNKVKIIGMLMTLLILLTGAVICGFCYENAIREKENERQKLLISSDVSLLNIYFKHPNTVGVEKEVEMVEGKYLLKKGEFTKMYFDLLLIPELAENWYEVEIELNDSFAVYLKEEKRREGEDGLLKITFSAYVCPEIYELNELNAESVCFSHMVGGILYEKECAILSTPLNVTIL